MCAGMSAGTGRASGVGLGAFACATEHFLIAALRRRVATVDLARLVSCAACPSDRLELHLDIEGAEYEVCQVPSIFAVHTHTDSHNGGASFILLLRLAHESAPATMAGAAPPACPRRCMSLPLDDGGRVARDQRAVSRSGLARAAGHSNLAARVRCACSPGGALIRL